jgi:hypothetical protein
MLNSPGEFIPRSLVITKEEENEETSIWLLSIIGKQQRCAILGQSNYRGIGFRQSMIG